MRFWCSLNVIKFYNLNETGWYEDSYTDNLYLNSSEISQIFYSCTLLINAIRWHEIFVVIRILGCFVFVFEWSQFRNVLHVFAKQEMFKQSVEFQMVTCTKLFHAMFCFFVFAFECLQWQNVLHVRAKIVNVLKIIKNS